MESVGTWLEQQTLPRMAVDPEAFVDACVELEVWTFWEASDALQAMQDYFEEDSVAATHRFLDVAVALHDGTLAEFTYDDDVDQTLMPTAIFWAAATAPFDEDGETLNRKAWRQAIMEALTEDD